MIKLFKNIRKNMLKEGKTANYLKYAIGEIVLVVIGILIALQINNWNEQRKRNNERKELIKSLISDFKETSEIIAAKEDENAEAINRTSRFLSLSYTNNDNVSVDSLQYYLSGAFRYPFFVPTLTSYEQAVATGKIGLIKDKEFLKDISEFFTAYNIYNQQKDIGGQMFYLGSIWEMRKEVGNLASLAGEYRDGTRKSFPQAYKFSDKEYRAFIKKPEVFAAIDNMRTIFYNVQDSFKNMDKKAETIIKELEQLK
ncbi:MAG: DUF6090 family protein [Gelidibacter sp.]